MKTRILNSEDKLRYISSGSTLSVHDAFNASLETQMVFCEWAGECWRWYINFVDESLQNLPDPSLVPLAQPISCPSPSPRTAPTEIDAPRGSRSPLKTSVKTAMRFVARSAQQALAGRERSDVESGAPSQLAPRADEDESKIPTVEEEILSFNDVSRLHYVERNVYEAQLVLNSNVTNLTALKDHYLSTSKSRYFPKALRYRCASDIQTFSRRLGGIIQDLREQQSRLDILLRLIANRKDLVGEYL